MNDNNTRTEILIIDDETGILDTLSDILGDEGYLTHTAANAEEARKKTSSTNPNSSCSTSGCPTPTASASCANGKKAAPSNAPSSS